jgi:hypothetical protein
MITRHLFYLGYRERGLYRANFDPSKSQSLGNRCRSKSFVWLHCQIMMIWIWRIMEMNAWNIQSPLLSSFLSSLIKCDENNTLKLSRFDPWSMIILPRDPIVSNTNPEKEIGTEEGSNTTRCYMSHPSSHELNTFKFDYSTTLTFLTVLSIGAYIIRWHKWCLFMDEEE